MRDHERFLLDLALTEFGHDRGLPPLRDAGLPLSVRVMDHLVEMLVAAFELRALLQLEEAGELKAFAPAIDRIYREVDEVLQRVAH